jgi:hypothetical protein
MHVIPQIKNPRRQSMKDLYDGFKPQKTGRLALGKKGYSLTNKRDDINKDDISPLDNAKLKVKKVNTDIEHKRLNN